MAKLGNTSHLYEEDATRSKNALVTMHKKRNCRSEFSTNQTGINPHDMDRFQYLTAYDLGKVNETCYSKHVQPKQGIKRTPTKNIVENSTMSKFRIRVEDRKESRVRDADV